MKSVTRHGLFFVYFLVSITTAQGQKNKRVIDSIIKAVEYMPDDTLKVARYGTLFEQLQFSNPDVANGYSKRALRLSKKLGYKKGIASSHFQFADFYKSKGNVDSARFYYEKAATLAKEANSIITQLFVNHSRGDFEKSLGNYTEALQYINKNIEIYDQADTIYRAQTGTFNLIGSEFEVIGSIHKELGNYQIALSETLKALHFFIKMKDTLREADALKQLGSIESILDNNKTAIEHTQRAYKIYELYDDKQYKAYAAIDIGSYFLELKQPKEAEIYFKEALKISKGIGSKDIEASSLTYLGDTYFNSNQIQKAGSYLSEGIGIYRKLDYKKDISSGLNQLARLERTNKKYAEAIAHLDESIQIAQAIKAKGNLIEAYSLRSAVNEDLANYKSALKDHQFFKGINDSVFNIGKSRQIEEMRAIFDTEKKEQEIAQQEIEISLLEEQDKVSNLQKMLLGGGLGLSLITLGLGFYGFRQRTKRNKLEKAKIEAELAFKRKELTTHALNLARKNETLENLKLKAKELKKNENIGAGSGYNQLIRSINFDLQDDNNWENFSRYFEEVHKDFNSNVKTKYPRVTSNELRLLALLKMNLSSKEIANILSISSEGIKKARYRLRKKLGLTTEDSLQDLVLTL